MDYIWYTSTINNTIRYMTFELFTPQLIVGGDINISLSFTCG